MVKPIPDEMLDEAARQPPGPDAWRPLFKAYTRDRSIREIAASFRQRGMNLLHEADGWVTDGRLELPAMGPYLPSWWHYLYHADELDAACERSGL